MSWFSGAQKSEYEKRKASGVTSVTDEEEEDDEEEDEQGESTGEAQDAYVKDHLDVGTHFAVLDLNDWYVAEDEQGLPDAAFFDRLYASAQLVPCLFISGESDWGPCLVCRKEAS